MGENGRELTLARWGMPSPLFALKGKNTDTGVTNVRNVKSPHWLRWLGEVSRCVVPFTFFSEYETTPDGKKVPPLVRHRREPPIGRLRRHQDELDLRAEGKGGRGHLRLRSWRPRPTHWLNRSTQMRCPSS